jgi:hypothetical protein
MARLHTVAALAFVAAVPLLPLGLWLYARAASVDRETEVRHARQVLEEAGPLPGGRNLGVSVYEERAWEGEGLVPISAYRLETAYRLPNSVKPAQVVAHYRHELRGWRTHIESLSCDTFGLPRGCTAVDATFTRGGDAVAIDTGEYMDTATMLREYGVIVSQ